MYNWDVIQPPESRAWNVLGLLEYETNPSPWAIDASIPNYDNMGNPTGTFTTKHVASAIQTRAMIENKFFNYKFLTGIYYSYKDNTYKPMCNDAEHAYYKFLTAWGNYKQGMQVWIDKIAQALSILDNPADNYNKHIHSILSYEGKEQNTHTPEGSETTTSERTGSYDDNLEKAGVETTQMSNGARTNTHSTQSYNSGNSDSDWLKTDKDDAASVTDTSTTTYGDNSGGITENRHVDYTDLKDTIVKQFDDGRKDTDVKQFVNRFDDYVMREWGNIGVTTYAQILTGIFGIASDADLFDFIMHDFFNKNCVL